MSAFIDRVGMRFGKLLVIARSFDAGSDRTRWLCQCDCGVIKSVGGSSLTTTRSCGCLKTGKTRGPKAHGCSRTPEYAAWLGMRSRCTNPASINYERYGGRGIKVCPEWFNDFLVFLRDMGPRPAPGLTVDRINNDGDYEPSNCHWATPKQQARNQGGNKVFTYKGKTQCLAAWAEEYGLKVATLVRRIHKGYSVEDALELPATGSLTMILARKRFVSRIPSATETALARLRAIETSRPQRCPWGTVAPLMAPETRI